MDTPLPHAVRHRGGRTGNPVFWSPHVAEFADSEPRSDLLDRFRIVEHEAAEAANVGVRSSSVSVVSSRQETGTPESSQNFALNTLPSFRIICAGLKTVS